MKTIMADMFLSKSIWGKRMMMRSFAFLFFLSAWQCGEKSSENDAAMEAAQKYYQALFAGDEETFLEGRCTADSFSTDYREQLLAGYKQFRMQQEQKYGHIFDINASKAVFDPASSSAQVFLVISYADSLKEEIVVPMVKKNGQWLMK